jgi:hypothetical protein
MHYAPRITTFGVSHFRAIFKLTIVTSLQLLKTSSIEILILMSMWVVGCGGTVRKITAVHTKKTLGITQQQHRAKHCTQYSTGIGRKDVSRKRMFRHFAELRCDWTTTARCRARTVMHR